MFGFGWLSRPIFFILATILALLLFVPFSPLHNYYFPDLKPEAYKLFIEDKAFVKDHENMVYAIKGLSAPKNIENVHKYSIENPVSKIKLEVDFDKLNCWLSKEHDQENVCYSKQEIKNIVNENITLINRYEDIYKYKKYDSDLKNKTYGGQYLISTHKLYMAYLRVDFEETKTFDKIIRDFNHKRFLVSQEGTWIEKAIYLVLFGLTMNQLEYHLVRYPNTAIEEKIKLLKALSGVNDSKFNIEGVFRKEYEVLSSIFCLYEKLGEEHDSVCEDDLKDLYVPAEFFTNDFYDEYITFKEISELDAIRLRKKCESINKKEFELSEIDLWWDTLVHFPLFPWYTVYTLSQGGNLKGCEMISNFKIKISKLKQYSVYIELISSQSNVDDYDDFLQNNADKDIVTGMPFSYNKVKNELGFPDGSPKWLAPMSMPQ